MKDRELIRRPRLNLLLANAGMAAGLLAPPAQIASHAALAALSVAALTLPALAQPKIEAVTPSYVVITQDQAPLLAGQVETHYRVALLPIGQILRVDYAVDGWVLAAYPPGTNAFVRASEVTPSPDGSTVRTNVASRLRAANMEGTSAASWSTLLVDPLPPLPAGTELKVVAIENRPDGTPGFYRVVAPPQARGFLRAGLYRAANPQETQDYLNRLAMAGQPPATPTGSEAPAPSTPPTTPSVTNPAPTPAPLNPQQTQPAGQPTNTPSVPPSGLDTSLLQDPSVPNPGDQVALPEAPPLVIDQSGSITGGPSPEAVPPSTDPVVLTVEGLGAAFEDIRNQPVREAEYEELIARFEQAVNGLTDSRDDERVKRGLQARLDLLRLRRDYRDSLRALDEGRRDAQDAAQRVAQRVDWLRTQGGYAVIGRLVPSSIYDGSSGPLMYRVVAVNTNVPRTLAYVRMDDEFTLPELVGKVVGVRGQVTIEPSIGTRIVQAESVDPVDVQN